MTLTLPPLLPRESCTAESLHAAAIIFALFVRTNDDGNWNSWSSYELCLLRKFDKSSKCP